jgi:hypothetical protein
MSEFKQPAISRLGVSLEQQYSLRDVRDNIWERGEQITLKLIGEEKIERDKFGNIVRRIPAVTEIFTFYAFPIIYNSTEKQQEKAGLREITQVIIYTAMQDWIDNNLEVDRLQDIDSIRSVIVIDNALYEIKDKNKLDQFSDNYLYVVLGLNKI